MQKIEKLELHYHLDDSSHAMDAFIRNKCEAEILAIFKETASVIGIQIKVDSVAYKEGGLIEVWSFIIDNIDKLGSFAGLITSLIALFKNEKGTNELDEEEKRLAIEERKLNIEKLKRELGEKQYIDKPDDIITSMDRNYKVAVRKSNFYKFLLSYKKVNKIGFTPLDKDSVPVADELIIKRNDFHKYILTSDKLPTETIDEAKIEIVAPVLKQGGYHWKGIYDGKPINFTMQDVEFKDLVLLKKVSFTNGSYIICTLNIHKKLDEVGNVDITGFSVSTVVKKIDGPVIYETSQGKRYLDQKKLRDGQQNLGF